MTAKQFRATLKQLGLTQAQLARLFNVDVRTVRRWAAGDVHGPTAILLWLLEAGIISLDDVEGVPA
jgi:transcriptional regulator with XRE-family HTH domain